jgi:hypothetical protein
VITKWIYANSKPLEQGTEVLLLENSYEEYSREDVLFIYEDLKKKWQILQNLDEEICYQITEEDEIIKEIIETNEYNSELNISLRCF